MISFVTPYLSGDRQMAIHLASIRRFYPLAPILISKKGGSREEMEGYRDAFGVRYWIEECDYLDALFRLLKRCDTEFVCVLDHDTVLLSSLDPYVAAIGERRYDLVGVEERIREPPGIGWERFAPDARGWLRLAPGHVDFSLVIFNLREFVARWGLRRIVGARPRRAKDYEFIYGLSQRLSRHKYLRPYHTRRYVLGNLLMDGDTRVAWHQWYGSHRDRRSSIAQEGTSSGFAERIALIEEGERAFLQDYPALDFSGLTPAWGPDRNVIADGRMIARRRPGLLRRTVRRAQGWWELGLRGTAARARNRLGRWWMVR